MIAVGLYFDQGGNKMPIVKTEDVIDSWAILISGGQGKAEEVFQNTDNFIVNTKVSNVKKERKKISPSVVKGLLGASRDFLVISETQNSKLKPYQMLIGVRDYGNNLDISWHLITAKTLWQRIKDFLSNIPVLNLVFLPSVLKKQASNLVKYGSLGLDLFDEQDLRAYVTNAHHCLLDAVAKLMLDLNQDPSKIDRKSKGFLGIS